MSYVFYCCLIPLWVFWEKLTASISNWWPQIWNWWSQILNWLHQFLPKKEIICEEQSTRAYPVKCQTGVLLRAWLHLQHGTFWGCAPTPLTKLDLIDWLIDWFSPNTCNRQNLTGVSLWCHLLPRGPIQHDATYSIVVTQVEQDNMMICEINQVAT